VLDRDEGAALAEIEAALRRDDPEFVLLLERLERDPLGIVDRAPIEAEHEPAPPEPAELTLALPVTGLVELQRRGQRWRLRILAVALAAVLAVAVTLAVTVVFGPDVGGLIGVISTMAASLFGYQLLRGCPGRRS
jgi:hypothetical protein